jgi:hypothetical protein
MESLMTKIPAVGKGHFKVQHGIGPKPGQYPCQDSVPPGRNLSALKEQYTDDLQRSTTDLESWLKDWQKA